MYFVCYYGFIVSLQCYSDLELKGAFGNFLFFKNFQNMLNLWFYLKKT
uniref:Uncharacterized protein n=1 Tax=Rhizophora mucronata TaxID=61149 RepID=A0A2P2KD10_RHIMU